MSFASAAGGFNHKHMRMTLPTPSFSIVIETENLALGGVDDLVRCLDSLARQTHDVGTAAEVLVMVGGQLDPGAARELAERYRWATFHQCNAELSYTAAKKLGAEIATGDVVVYADSDVWYDPRWLELMLAECSRHEAPFVVFSDTRIPSDSPYGFAMSVAWMLPVLPAGEAVRKAGKFRLNNFAINRPLMRATEFDEDLPLYRGTVELWRQRLRLQGVSFYRIPKVVGEHLAPQGLGEWWYRMLVLGADSVAVADYRQLPDGTVEAAPSRRRRLLVAARTVADRLSQAVRRTRMLLAEDAGNRRLLPLGLPIAAASLAVQAIGCLVAVVNSRAVYDAITAYEASHD